MAQSVHVVCPSCKTVNRVPSARLEEGPACGRCRSRLFTGQPLELTAATFDRHVGRSDLPVVVDFWAAWCGPCKTMAPVFAQAAARLEPRIRLGKVDTERESALAARFQVQSIPTLALFRGGTEVARQAGAMPLESLVGWVRSHV